MKRDGVDIWGRDYKLIALDIDGTLINSRQMITRRTREAIDAAKAAGIKVTMATGRHYNSARIIARSVKINAPMVSNDGALITDIASGEILSKHFLPLDVAKGVLDIAADYENLKVQIFRLHDKIYAGENYRLEMAKRLIRSPKRLNPRGIYNFLKSFFFVPVKNTGDIAGAKEALGSPPAKVIVYGNADELKEFSERICIAFEEEVSFTTAIVNCVDVLLRGVSKAKGLSELAEMLNILPEEVVAIGDNFNDLEMINFAGLGVAMGNASDEVKGQADFVTKSNDEDGVAYVIEKLLHNIDG